MTLSSLIEIIDDKELTEEFNKLKPIVRYNVKKIEDEAND